MSQYTHVMVANESGTDYRTKDTSAKAAISSHHKGSTAPSYAVTGMMWLDDAANPLWVLKLYNGSSWIEMGTFDSTNSYWKPKFALLANGATNYGASSAGSDAYAITSGADLAAYSTGQIFTVLPDVSNTGACSLNVDSIGVKSIKTLHGDDPATGMILANQPFQVIYDGTNMILLTYPTAMCINAQTGTTYTVLTSDRGKVVTQSNASSIATTLPQAGSGFEAGWHTHIKNIGVGTVTITPSTSTIDGSASITLTTGAGVTIVSDGTNYYTIGGGRQATETTKGIAELATTAEAAAGSDTERVVTPAGVAAAIAALGSSLVIASGSFSAQSALNFDNTIVTSSYSALKITILLKPDSTDAKLIMRVSDDNGSTVKSGLSDYKWGANNTNSSGGVGAGSVDTADSEIELSRFALDATAAGGLSLFVIYVRNHSDSNAYTSVHGHGGLSTAGLIDTFETFTGVYLATSVINYLRFLMSDSGNFSGSYMVEGIE